MSWTCSRGKKAQDHNQSKKKKMSDLRRSHGDLGKDMHLTIYRENKREENLKQVTVKSKEEQKGKHKGYENKDSKF